MLLLPSQQTKQPVMLVGKKIPMKTFCEQQSSNQFATIVANNQIFIILLYKLPTTETSLFVYLRLFNFFPLDIIATFVCLT
jgi:hypothetical protein